MPTFHRRLMQLWTLAVLGGCAAANGAETETFDPAAAEVTAEGAAAQEAGARVSELDFEIPLRGTGKAQIHARIYGNPRRGGYETVLAVHGLSETGATFEPLANAIFADPTLKRRIRRVIAIDLVGRGESGFPQGLPNEAKFGDLTIEDNGATVLESIEVLRRRFLAPQTLIGHSMGGLAVQAAQEALLAKGSSLSARGVYSAVLLAPVPAGGRPWTQPVTGDLSQFVVQDPAQGAYVSLPPELWLAQAFSTTAGTLVPNAPTPATVAERGYIGLEPLTTLFQLTGAPIPTPTGETITLARPTVRAGAFASTRGTRLTVVGFTEDVLVPAANLGDLYGYLTGDASNKRYVAVQTPDAVHSMFISNPTGVIAAARNAL